MKDIGVGTSSSYPAQLTNAGGTLYFSADDGLGGRELWKSDGTSVGTVLVKDLAPGAAGAISLDSLSFVNGQSLLRPIYSPSTNLLYFSANDQVTGSELWQSDGTTAGTIRVADLVVGTGGSAPLGLEIVGNRLYYSAVTTRFGRELWSIELTTPPQTSVIVDDGDAGFSVTGTWTQTSSGRGNDVRYAGFGTGTSVATWTFAGLTEGTYRVSATWPASGNRSNAAPYRIRTAANGPDLVTRRLNQQVPPNDRADAGSTWGDLGVVTITGNTLVVQLTNNVPSGFVIADAIRVERVPAQIIDDGDSGFVTTGAWITSTTGRGGDLRYSNPGIGSNVATWSFTGLSAGQYRVSTTWAAAGNRTSMAPYLVRDTLGGPNLLVRRLDQRIAPNDRNVAGSDWEDIGIVSISGNTLVVQLTNNVPNGIVIADAVRIELVPAHIIDDGSPGFSTTGNWIGTAGGRDGDVRYAAAGAGTSVATWTFTGLAAGRYTLAATWSPASNRSTNAPYRIRETATGPDLLTVRHNQRQRPSDFRDSGSEWQTLGTVTITGNTLVVQLTNDTTTGLVMADAIRLVPA